MKNAQTDFKTTIEIKQIIFELLCFALDDCYTHNDGTE